MWFKNAIVYRLHAADDVNAGRGPGSLEIALQEQAARELFGAESRRVGWIPPAGRGGKKLLHELNGHRLMTMLRQERILPASVVKEEVEERVAGIEANEQRKLSRQERQNIKEQVYEEFLPRAFVRTQKVDLWWDTTRSLLVINTSSRKRAEEVLDLLRETLGSLKVTPLVAQTLPIRTMTLWLSDPGSRPEGMAIGDQVELMAKGDDGVIRGRQVDLDSEDMQHLLDADRQASKLAVEVEGKASFILTDDLAFKSIKFDDALIEEANQTEDEDDAIVRLETDFLLMSQAMGAVIDSVVGWLGGEAGNDAGIMQCFDPTS